MKVIMPQKSPRAMSTILILFWIKSILTGNFFMSVVSQSSCGVSPEKFFCVKYWFCIHDDGPSLKKVNQTVAYMKVWNISVVSPKWITIIYCPCDMPRRDARTSSY